MGRKEWLESPVLSIIMVCLTSSAAHAQSEAMVRGQLLADADGSVIAKGSVTLESIGSGASTMATVDASGHFAFQNVSAGEYLLTGSAAGFTNKGLRLAVEPREVRTVSVRLAIAGIAEIVKVRGALAPLPSTHSPSSTILVAGRIERVPGTERTALPDAIVTAAPGMIRGHDDFVHVRGEEVALNPLINGVSFWETRTRCSRRG